MVLLPIDGTTVAATASLVVRLFANSTILIDASSLKFFESVPKSTLSALVPPELSGELVKGNMVAVEMNVTGVFFAYKYNKTATSNPAARIINLNFFKRLKINLVKSAVVTIIFFGYCKLFISKYVRTAGITVVATCNAKSPTTLPSGLTGTTIVLPSST